MDIIVILAIVALVVWLIAQFAPVPGWVAKAALIVLLVCLTLLAADINFESGDGNGNDNDT